MAGGRENASLQFTSQDDVVGVDALELQWLNDKGNCHKTLLLVLDSFENASFDGLPAARRDFSLRFSSGCFRSHERTLQI